MFKELTKFKSKLKNHTTDENCPISDSSAGLTISSDIMMSQHLNSVLEHLRIGCSLKKSTPATTTTTTTGDPEPLASKSENVIANNTKSMSKINGNTTCDEIDKSISAVNNVSHHVSRGDLNRKLSQINKNEMSPVMLCANNDVCDERNFNPKKRFSIPGGPQQLQANGDLRNKNRDLSPVPRNMPRKLSQDLRFRGSNSQLNDDGIESRIRRPIKVKHLTSNYETYDTLHAKAVEVSLNQIKFLFFRI